ncbi:MAG: multidrug ABC transporter ATP-binding protein, partial [Burkholderiaceae bacterium]
MFAFFEKLVRPYPDAVLTTPPRQFLPFVWACTQGLRGLIAAMTFFTAAIGVFEALLFAVMGQLVDWLAHIAPDRLWADEGGKLLLLAGVIVASLLLSALQPLFKHQALAGNFPMLLRWNFHRLMLAQSMSFYQDEFAGRVA